MTNSTLPLPASPRAPNLFISHKHDDSAIADVVRRFVDRWSLKKVRVFQSSATTAGAPRPGRYLTTELKRALWEAGVVLLIYTTEDQDWAFCTWECGVAMKPDSPDTNLIVLQCSDKAPKVFSDQVRIDARDPKEVHKLVKLFLTDPAFFPDQGGPIAPGFTVDGPDVKDAADNLFAGLAEVLPKATVGEWSAQPLLTLELPLSEARRIERREAGATPVDEAASVTLDDKARQIFALEQLDEHHSFRKLTERWRERRPGRPVVWADEIVTQLQFSLRNETPALKWAYLLAVNDSSRYVPVLSRVRRRPGQRVIQFDFNLLPYDTLTATPVTARMLARGSMVAANLGLRPLDKQRLVELAERFDREGATRIPLLDGQDRVRFVVHRSMIDRYIARRALAPNGGRPLSDLTLEDLMTDDPELKTMFEQGFAFVPADARMSDASAKMACRRECQDVFVTATGSAEEPVMGWLTNVMLAQATAD